MGVRHHPAPELCADYRTGNIAPGASLAMIVHLGHCNACRLALQEPRIAGAAPFAGPDTANTEAELPPVLRDLPRERWRRLGSGARAARLRSAAGLGESVQLLLVARGRPVPESRALEILVVIAGGASGLRGEVAPGDLLEFKGARAGLTADGATGLLALVVGDEGLYRGALAGLLG